MAHSSTLQSLACGKKEVLKIPPGKDVNDEDVFMFNEDFVKNEELEGRRGYRIHINGIQGKVESTHQSIQSDRKRLLDGASARIMKASEEQ
ncbi:hypothetical protein BT96DRAFT_1018742 [Gymnopus androsaceus JB14]|uniref:Uncharacterized protein n=1 Tax=Gymnopus androsaceus JB14 TaxID=1447944 RepID=A0A6A4HV52_9AGAR|nr:hypothetical protein BT96DRAFT_1018742 [Gymnopus androsaceus JB14]